METFKFNGTKLFCNTQTLSFKQAMDAHVMDVSLSYQNLEKITLPGIKLPNLMYF